MPHIFASGLILILIIFSAPVIAADSIASRKSLFIIPHMAYQQETSWSAGIAGGYYFKSKDISRISSISGSADYTLLNQFIFNITPKIYLSDKKWYIYSNLNLKKYPDYYYGVGNAQPVIKQPFTSQALSFQIQPQYAFTKEFLVGLVLSYKYENVIAGSGFETNKDFIFDTYGADGWSAFNVKNIGLVVSYDSRDNQFYPTNGLFAKLVTSGSSALLKSTYKTTDITLDIRKYIPVFRENVFALQGYVATVFSDKDVPFQLLPTLGGRDFLRGFRQGMYRDNMLFLIQSEYRFSVYRRLKAAAFCSAGDVINTDNFRINRLKIAYGAGLRYRLNDARVHLRFDIAKNNYGEKLQFYITATEAF